MATTLGTPSPVARSGWRGATREYDLVKEFVVALVVVAFLAGALAAVFSSPDERPVTMSSWAAAAPGDFVTTATGELAGTTTSAGYGAPYNTGGEGQTIGPLALQRWAGVRVPVDPANDFVVRPLSAHPTAAVSTALGRWNAAADAQRTAWATAYADALAKADGDPTKVAAGDYGSVPDLTAGLLELARSGQLDGLLTAAGNGFYGMDYTKPMLFLGDSGYLDDLAGTHQLHGEQWGMMNETGNYPGQAWLWLYTFWYQVPPFTTSWADNADALIWGLMMVLSLALLLVPFIPGLRSLPARLGVHRLIWRNYHRHHGG